MKRTLYSSILLLLSACSSKNYPISNLKLPEDQNYKYLMGIYANDQVIYIYTDSFYIVKDTTKHK